MKLFWDRSNWQSMSKACHDRKTAREDSGFAGKRRH
jgi:5-methylcytosine-specific restriction protein A